MCLQLVYSGRILKLRVRGTKKDLTQDTSSEEVCVVMSGVIARFDGSDIQVYYFIYLFIIFCCFSTGTKNIPSFFPISKSLASKFHNGF